ncbi:MAG TPA: DUF2905 domain-containing protein [Bryobacteraceae bacterium]|nr:DUF2905 domain-containing protein [Bryobacteraceae bacterium]
MSAGRTLILIGAVILVFGIVLTLGERLPIRFGRLPGDINVRGKNWSFHFPLMTSILLSLVLTLLLWFFNRR